MSEYFKHLQKIIKEQIGLDVSLEKLSKLVKLILSEPFNYIDANKGKALTITGFMKFENFKRLNGEIVRKVRVSKSLQ